MAKTHWQHEPLRPGQMVDTRGRSTSQVWLDHSAIAGPRFGLRGCCDSRRWIDLDAVSESPRWYYRAGQIDRGWSGCVPARAAQWSIHHVGREGWRSLHTREVLEGVDLGDEVYVGLFVCSHNATVIEKAEIDNVRITQPAADDFRPYRDYIGSQLETMEIATGHRRVVLSVPDSLQAPNWSRDNQLIYNRNGKLYRIPSAGGPSEMIETGTAIQNNNDHVLSFDGRWLGISNHTGPNRKSVIFTLPVSGGVPKQVTRGDMHSYLHGWSPDGKYLLYTAERNGDFDIHRISVEGGEEVNLSKTPGSTMARVLAGRQRDLL